MTSVAGNEKLGSNFSLLSLEATAASKQLNEMTSCLGFTHLWPNLLKSLSKHNSLPVSYQPFSFLLPFTIVWSTFGCLVTIPCTEQIRMHFQLCFFFFFSPRDLPLFQGKDIVCCLRIANDLLPQRTTQTVNAAYLEMDYTAMHIHRVAQILVVLRQQLLP